MDRTNRIDISFIVPCYNIQNYIEGCVLSIENQSLAEQGFTYEILLINDCSPDGTRDVIEKLAKENNHCIAVHHKKNTGISGVRNDGIALAKGEYIWFVDGDDWLYPKAAPILLKYAKKYNADKLVANYYETSFDEEYNPNLNLPEISEDLIEHGKNEIYPVNNQHGAFGASTCCGLWKRSFLLENKLLFNTEVCMTEDLLFNFQSEYFDRYCVKVSIPCYIYRVGRVSATTDKSTVAKIKGYESGKKLVEIFSSYLPIDDSDKLKRRIDVKIRNMLGSLVAIPDTAYVKKAFNELKNEKLFPPKYYFPSEVKQKGIRSKLKENVSTSVGFWISHYINKIYSKVK